GVKAPGHVCKAFAFTLADAISVLRIKADSAVLVHHLRMKTDHHVFFELDLGVRADRRILDHGHADGMPGQMSKRKPGVAENISRRLMDFAGGHAIAHSDSRGLHRMRID